MNYLIKKKDCPIVMTEMFYPFRILYVNTSWEELCGYKMNEIKGKSILILKKKDIIKSIEKNISINKKKNNNLFLHFFKIYNFSKYNISIGKTISYQNLYYK